MASSDFGIPTELNPGVDRSPAAPAVTRRIYIPPSNNTEFSNGGDIQFRLPTAEPGSMLDAKYTYMKFNLGVTMTGRLLTSAEIPAPTSSANSITADTGWYTTAALAAANKINVGGDYDNTMAAGTALYKKQAFNPDPAVLRFPSCGGSSIFDRLEVYQGGVPVEQISYYNVIAKKFFQSEAGDTHSSAWKQGWFLGTGMGAGWGSTEGNQAGGCAYGGDGTVPSSKFQQMTGQYRAFSVNQFYGPCTAGPVGLGNDQNGAVNDYTNLKFVWCPPTEEQGVANFEFCVPILSGLVGLWAEKFLPLMLLGVSSFYLNFKLADIQSILEPISNTMSPSGMDPDASSGNNVAVDICRGSGITLGTATSDITSIASYKVTNVELVCTQVLLLPSVTQLLYANANQNSISWTTTSRRDYPQIMSGTAGGWQMESNQGHPKWDDSTGVIQALDLIVPCRLQSVRSFDLIMTYIGTESIGTGAHLGVSPFDRLFFLNPVYTSLQFKKGSEFFPQRPMKLNHTMSSWIPGVSPELTAESLIGEDGWFPFNQKEGSTYMSDEWRVSHVAPWTRQMGSYVYSHDCRTFRGVDASTRSGISFEKEQFNIVMSINPLGGDKAVILTTQTTAALVGDTGSMGKLDLSTYRFHFIPVYDMMVTITPTGSMEVAY